MRSRTLKTNILDKYEICCYGKFIDHSKGNLTIFLSLLIHLITYFK